MKCQVMRLPYYRWLLKQQDFRKSQQEILHPFDPVGAGEWGACCWVLWVIHWGREQMFPNVVLRTEQAHPSLFWSWPACRPVTGALEQLRGQGVCSNTVCGLQLGSIRKRSDSFDSRECSIPKSLEEDKLGDTAPGCWMWWLVRMHRLVPQNLLS